MEKLFLKLKKLQQHARLSQTLAIVLLVLLAIPAIKDNFRPGYFSMHDNLQAMRLLVMDKCFQDQQIPCRWSEDLGNEYGYPIFNFYPPLPYYLGEIFHWLSFQFVDIVKILVIINFLISAIFMYILAKEFWGNVGGIIAGVFYTYAPYHAVDLYVRGAVDEAFSLMFFPITFWSIYKVITQPQFRYIIFLTLSIAGLLLSHNPMLMAFAPAAVIWALFWLISTKKLFRLKGLLISGIWGLGIAAFFTLPVLFEQQYIHTEGLIGGYYNYIIHFVTLNQLFISPFWGYGGSTWGPNDGLSFQVGYFHSAALIIGFLTAVILFRRQKSTSLMIFLMMIFFAFYTFLTHNKSTFIWQAIPQLKYLQFPWRLLALSIFTTSFLSGSIVILLRKISWRYFTYIVALLIIISTILFYKDYFHWDRHFSNYSDGVWFSGQNWTDQVASSIYDYLPLTAKTAPPSIPASPAQIVKGQGIVKTVFKNSLVQTYDVKITQPAVFQINTLYFPGWKYYLNNQQLSSKEYKLDKTLGIPEINLPVGTYQINAKFTNTPIRTFADVISLISLGLFIIVLIKYALSSRLLPAKIIR